jgi:hypothetical protein
VWGANVGVISEYFVGDIKLKNTKNMFSLLRNLIKIIMDFNKFKHLYEINSKNEEEVIEAFEKRVENFQTDSHKKMLMQTIKIRAKLRIKFLDIAHSFLRICMCIYSLKIEPFYSNLHPIFTSFCGVIHSIISLYKVLIDVETSQPLGSFKKINNTKGKNRRMSLEQIINEIDETSTDTKKILEDNYFDNYYVDFNKDFPVHPNNSILKNVEHKLVNYFNN